MNVTPIIERLGSSTFRHVFGASDFAQAQDLGTKTTPVAYVMLDSYRDAENEFSTLQLSQQRTSQVAVVIVVGHARGKTAKKQDELADCMQYVEGRLLGWQPGDDYNPIQSVGGRVLAVRDNQIWFSTLWKTQHHIRSI